MYGKVKEQLTRQLTELRAQGLYKTERVITTPQSARVRVGGGAPVLNFCANNYLGLASHPAILDAARDSLDKWGYGMASVRFICGTQAPHRELERKLSQFLGTEDTILYSSCFDANGGLFETLLGAEDAIISDELNHASIIDGVRLCKAQRYRYKNSEYGRPRSPVARGQDGALPHDRHRRRLFDGRLHCQSAGHLRSGGKARRPSHGG